MPNVLRLGEIRVHVLCDGVFALDGGALFGVVPRVIWEKTDPPDEKNRVALGLNVVLVEAGGRRVLVDTGLGDKWTPREREIYRIDRERNLLGNLRSLGLGPEDIDVVVNTHLHFDHAGGNTAERDGRVRPVFPRARYVVQKGEFYDATHPHERNRASYLEPNFVPVAEAGQLDLVEGEVEVAPGVRVVPMGGHTAHHQIVVVESAGERLLVPTDLCDCGLDGLGVEAHHLRGGVAQHGVGGREALERLAEVVGRRGGRSRHGGEDATDRDGGSQGSHPHLNSPASRVRRPGRGR